MDIIDDYRVIIENAQNYKYRYIAYLSGRMGLAKSTNISRALLTIGMMKRLKIACVRETMNSIKDSVHAQLSEEIRENDLPYVIYKESIFCPATGSEIIFKGLRETNQHNIRSMAGVDVAWIEEAQAITPTSWESFAPTIRKKGAFIIIAGNPDQESDKIYQEFGPNAPRRDDTYYCYKDYRYNPFKLPDEVLHDIELMKKNRPDDYDRIYLGHLRKTAELPVVKSWSAENIGVGRIGNSIIFGLDFNFTPQCSVICHWDGLHDFYFSDEIVLEHVSTLTVAEEFVKIYRQKYQGCKVIVNGDASGRARTSNSEYSNYAIIENVFVKHRIPFTFNVPKTNPSVSNRVANFDWHVKGLDGKRHILVDPSCKHLIQSCKMLSYDKHGNIEEPAWRPGMKTIDYAKSHIFDAASYCVMTNDPVLEQFMKKPKSKIVSIREQFERDLRASVRGSRVVI